MEPERDRGRREGPSSALRFEKAEAPKGAAHPAAKWRKAASRKAKEAAPAKITSTPEAVAEDGPGQQDGVAAPGEVKAAPRGGATAKAGATLTAKSRGKFRPQAAARGREAPAPDAGPPQQDGGKLDQGGPRPTGAEVERSGPGPDTSGQVVPKSPYRETSNAQPSERLHQGDDTGAFRQEPEAKLHRDGEAAPDTPKPKRRPRGRREIPEGDGGGAAPPPSPEPDTAPLNRAKLRMDKREGKLNTAKDRLAAQKPPKRPGPLKRTAGAAGGAAYGYLHSKVYEVEHENVGVEAAHRVELAGEVVGRQAAHTARSRLRSRPNRAIQKAERKYTKAKADFHFRQARLEHPELEQRPLARLWKRRQLRAQQVKKAQETTKGGTTLVEKAVDSVENLVANMIGFIRRHPGGAALLLMVALLIFSVQSCASALAAIGNGLTGSVAATTYPAEDADLLGAEAAYTQLEADLQSLLDNYEATHDYDEYHFDLDGIEHDPYVLLSILSALHEDTWTLADVGGDLQDLFDRQYILTENVTVETRYYTDTYTWTDEDGEEHEDSEEVPYDYYICYVTLENFNLSHVPVYMMGDDQLSRYSLYMGTLGNRPDLFPTSAYIGKYLTDPPEPHEVPESYLEDATFAAIMAEATKYLGYPYVWGGSTPATSFDCSGFVCWVVNHSGWDVGRIGAQALYNRCAAVRSPRPGDLVFFTGTFDAPGVTHCGIYVGDGWMLHCGDPIQYADLNTAYWQSHFYAYGRLR